MYHLVKNVIAVKCIVYSSWATQKTGDLINTFLQYLVTRKLNVGSQKNLSAGKMVYK